MRWRLRGFLTILRHHVSAQGHHLGKLILGLNSKYVKSADRFPREISIDDSSIRNSSTSILHTYMHIYTYIYGVHTCMYIDRISIVDGKSKLYLFKFFFVVSSIDYCCLRGLNETVSQWWVTLCPSTLEDAS